jgi:CheY-like chemotaxis protein
MRTVLIADDDPDGAEALRYLLEHHGYHVDVVTNGAEALAYFDAGGRPCVVILDLMMPVMDGHEFLAIRRTNPTLSQTKVFVMTASGAGLDASDVVVLRKPVHLPILMEHVERACESRN